MKKIAIVSTSYYPNIWNGQGRSTFSIAFGLAKKGYDVSVFTFTSKQATYSQQDGQVMVYYVGGVTDNSATSLPFTSIGLWNERVLALLLCEKFDTVILNNWHGFEAAKKYSQAKIISFIPFLYNFTGWLKPLTFGLEAEIKLRENNCITESDLLVAHTEKFGNKLSIYSNKEVVLIPNCYLNMLNDEAPTSIAVKPNSICFVGRVNREKSIERIIRVLPDISEATFTVASPENKDDFFVTKLQRLAKDLDVEHRVSFTGWLSTKDVRDLYRASACAVVPSQFEPFGYSAIDPMSLGVPTVVSEWSCLDEYLGKNAKIFSSLAGLSEQISSTLKASKLQLTHEAIENAQILKTTLSEDFISDQIISIL